MSAVPKTAATGELPDAIGRFVPVRMLGRGGQGIVYLAHDPKLDRQVAIKTLHSGTGGNAGRLIEEARKVARLDHPGIVPVYEIDIAAGTPYLVCQFVDGTPLHARIDETAPMPAHEVVGLISRILEAINHAHQQGILHRDITPANILVGRDDQPRILDFGVATVAGQKSADGTAVGTINYLPPECLSNAPLGPYSDIFSIGVIFHELLTGRRLFQAENPLAIAYKILNDKIVPPSVRNPDVDPALDAVVLKALSRDHAARYQSAAAMLEDLREYSAPKSVGSEDDPPSSGSDAIDFMLRRMARKPDFPAVSRHISEINQKTGSRDLADANELSNIILKDYALTTKLLRLVNSAVYGQYGGTITTVSRAVVILGFDQVRAAALGIAVFEHLRNGDQADALKDAACSSFLSATLARSLCGSAAAVDPEEGFIGAMFHRLGRHLAIYYFPEEYVEIRSLMQSRDLSEDAAAREILGTSYGEFGLAVGRRWNFPDNLTCAMKQPPRGKVARAADANGQMAQVAALANEVAEITGTACNNDELERRLNAVATRYGDCMNIGGARLKELVSDAVEDTRAYAGVLSLDLESASFFKNVIARVSDTAGGAATPATARTEPATRQGAAAVTTTEPPSPDRRKAFLVQAISELATAILEDAPINDLFVMVTESLYRGLGFDHVILMLRNPRCHEVQARFGFGADVEAAIPEFRFKTSTQPDVFNEAVRKGRQSVVVDTQAEQYAERIPDWCRRLTAPESLMLFPVIANRACLGLIYADTVNHKMGLSADELKLVATLVKQLTLAIQQRR